MKNAVIYLFLALFAISGCKKYDEGPAISLRSKEKRLCQEWKLDSYLVNGEDFNYFEEQVWTIEKNGTLIVYIDYGVYDEEAEFEWRWSDKKEGIEIYDNSYKSKFFSDFKNISDEDWVSVDIKRLTFDELFLEHTEGDENIRFEFIK